jgi:heme-degrading monooxygenase HmoA
MIAQTPPVPYYAVTFTSVRAEIDECYESIVAEMRRLGIEQEGFLGIESARNDTGITVSYWQSSDSIRKWKANTTHKLAQTYGSEKWYENYNMRICKVERDCEF